MALALQKCFIEQNFHFTNPPKVWISGFLNVNGNRKFVSAIMKKTGKMAIARTKLKLGRNGTYS